jgi:2-keto-3-deoxy-L-rhamnonate aldolase RhmA
MVEFANGAKRRLAAGELAVGMIVRLARVPDIVTVARVSGHDFLFIDTQHVMFDVETIGAICQLAQLNGVAPIVRVRSYLDPDIGRLLDAGAMGIIVPDVSTVVQARRVVEACRYAPLGERSFASPPPGSPMDGLSTAALDAETLVVCMIETREGVANVEAIAATEGVDVLHVGANDLLLDMGLPGAYASDEMAAAMDKVISAAAASGKWAGLGGDRDAARRVEYIRRGVRFFSSQTDLAMLVSEARRTVRAFRSAAEQAGMAPSD